MEETCNLEKNEIGRNTREGFRRAAYPVANIAGFRTEASEILTVAT